MEQDQTGAGQGGKMDQRSGATGTRRDLLKQAATAAAGITLLGIFGDHRPARAKTEECGQPMPGQPEYFQHDADCTSFGGEPDDSCGTKSSSSEYNADYHCGKNRVIDGDVYTDRDNACGLKVSNPAADEDDDCGQSLGELFPHYHMPDARCGVVYSGSAVYEDAAFASPQSWTDPPYPEPEWGEHPKSTGAEGSQAEETPPSAWGDPGPDVDQSCGKETNYHYTDRDGTCGRESGTFVSAADLSCGVSVQGGQMVFKDWNCGEELYDSGGFIDRDNSCGETIPKVGGSELDTVDSSCLQQVLKGSLEAERKPRDEVGPGDMEPDTDDAE